MQQYDLLEKNDFSLEYKKSSSLPIKSSIEKKFLLSKLEKYNPVTHMLTLYTKDYCPYCTKAKNLLSSIGASFEEIDITETPEVIMELAKKSKMRTIPQIFLDDISLGGYSDIEALHRAGKLKEIL